MVKAKRKEEFFDTETGLKMFTVAEAAKYLKYHPASIRRLVVRGELKPHSRAGNMLLFLGKELEKFKYSNEWALKKSKARFLPNPPPKPSSEKTMSAVVVVLVKDKKRLFKRLKTFQWKDVPSIISLVYKKYGNIHFDISVRYPDGTAFDISSHNSDMSSKNYDIIRDKLIREKRKKDGKTAWLI
ncbi:MAG: helix-turn-helix domain-containing protein [Elusimicrobiota bacterium]|nr:helix-turn-helix domain-containing protein [Elusimicrobiota bacterium]